MDKVIVTERLTIKPYQESDAHELAELLTNESIKETFMIPDYPSQEALNDAVRKLFRLSVTDEHFERGIFLKDALIGFVNEVETVDNEIEIGYVIHPNYQNQGYATEMFSAVIRVLLKEGYAAVTAGAFEQNTASIRVMQKCGLTKARKEEDIIYHEKTMHCVYYILKA